MNSTTDTPRSRCCSPLAGTLAAPLPSAAHIPVQGFKVVQAAIRMTVTPSRQGLFFPRRLPVRGAPACAGRSQHPQGRAGNRQACSSRRTLPAGGLRRRHLAMGRPPHRASPGAEQTAFVLDLKTFKLWAASFNYPGEGWGLTRSDKRTGHERRHARAALPGPADLQGSAPRARDRGRPAGGAAQRAGVGGGPGVRQHLADRPHRPHRPEDGARCWAGST